MINFIIPSIGRLTLKNTLESLISQSHSDWNCWVGFDGITKEELDTSILIEDSRINYLFSSEKQGNRKFHGNAGLVRNWIISSISNNYEWLAFVDDDDTLTHDYIEKLKEEIEYTDFDCCIFRMRYDANNQRIVPPYGMKVIQQNFVGISFCVNKIFINTNNIKFINSDSEDYNFLEQINNKNGEIYLSEHITYNVNGYSYTKNE